VVHSEHGRRFDDRPLRLRVQRWMSRHTRAVMAVSAQLKADLVQHVGIPAAAIGVLYNGVDSTVALPGARLQARNGLGIDAHTIVIGSVGRMVAVKNYPLLLKAVAALGRRDVCLLMVGEGCERVSLKSLAAQLGVTAQVRFLGHRDDVRALLPGFDIFVLPSLSEGLSNTLLEAMAAGVACVASDVGGNPEIIRHGQDGLLFASGDAAALQARLALLCSDPSLRAGLAQAGSERIAATFSMAAMIAGYAALYQGALQHAVPRP
jgi:glycosyltransferase involved in cell wall biosynthesis